MENTTGLSTSLWDWKGLRVDKISFEGVTFDAVDTLPKELPQKVDTPLDPQAVRASLRRLFASGRYKDISVRGIRNSTVSTSSTFTCLEMARRDEKRYASVANLKA